MDITTINAWKTYDGKVHSSLEEAQKHLFIKCIVNINEDIESYVIEALWKNRIELFSMLASLYKKPDTMTIAGD